MAKRWEVALWRYNRDVLDRLRKISPEHADALNARGTVLGWWHDVQHFYHTGRTPAEAAEMVSRNTLQGN